MEITLEYVAMLKVMGPASGSRHEIPEGATVSALLHGLGLKPEHQKVIVPFVNNTKAKPDHVLHHGDHVFLAMPVGGG